MAETVKTKDPTVSLALTYDQLRTLLADNTDLVQGLFRARWPRVATPVPGSSRRPARRTSSS